MEHELFYLEKLLKKHGLHDLYNDIKSYLGSVVKIDISNEDGIERMEFFTRLLYKCAFLEHPGECNGKCDQRFDIYGEDSESITETETEYISENREVYSFYYREPCSDYTFYHNDKNYIKLYNDVYKLFLFEDNTDSRRIYIKTPASFYNNYGRHEDYFNRGHYDCDKYYGFHEDRTLESGVYTLEELAEFFWGLKSIKFNNWYELVSRACYHRNGEFVMDIDHGS